MTVLGNTLLCIRLTVSQICFSLVGGHNGGFPDMPNYSKAGNINSGGHARE